MFPSVQLADHEIGPVLKHYLDGLGQPTSDQTKVMSPVSRCLFQQWSQLVVQDEVLFGLKVMMEPPTDCNWLSLKL